MAPSLVSPILSSFFSATEYLNASPWRLGMDESHSSPWLREEKVLVVDEADIDEAQGIPIVLAHGMGDACDSPGFSDVIEYISDAKEVPVTCIGDHGVSHKAAWHEPIEYTEDVVERGREEGFFGSLNTAVEYFAVKVKAMPWLKDGFHVMGWSQGNLVLRGYVQRYNDPPVLNWVSIHGPLMGVGGLPLCDPGPSSMCRSLFKYASYAAYTTLAQENVFQADYVRNPLMMDKYLTVGSFLPDMNNEIKDDDPKKKGKAEEYRRNLSSLKQLVLVKADHDQFVYPNESSWFGFYEDESYDVILPIKEAAWYKGDWFGLKQLDDEDKIQFLTSVGGHCALTDEEFDNLLTYI